jgi:hypothetical protein
VHAKRIKLGCFRAAQDVLMGTWPTGLFFRSLGKQRKKLHLPCIEEAFTKPASQNTAAPLAAHHSIFEVLIYKHNAHKAATHYKMSFAK